MDAWISRNALREIKHDDKIKLVINCWCKRKIKKDIIVEKITIVGKIIIDKSKVIKEVIIGQIQII